MRVGNTASVYTRASLSLRPLSATCIIEDWMTVQRLTFKLQSFNVQPEPDCLTGWIRISLPVKLPINLPRVWGIFLHILSI